MPPTLDHEPQTEVADLPVAPSPRIYSTMASRRRWPLTISALAHLPELLLCPMFGYPSRPKRTGPDGAERRAQVENLDWSVPQRRVPPQPKQKSRAVVLFLSYSPAGRYVISFNKVSQYQDLTSLVQHRLHYHTHRRSWPSLSLVLQRVTNGHRRCRADDC